VAGPGDAKRRPELGGAAVHRKASGAFSTMRQLGGAFGVAILVAVSGRVAVGQVSSGAWPASRLPDGGVLTPDLVRAGAYQVNVGGRR